MEDLVHIHKNRLNTNYSILLLLLPPVVFVLVLLLSFSKFTQIRTANIDTNTYVLGEEAK